MGRLLGVLGQLLWCVACDFWVCCHCWWFGVVSNLVKQVHLSFSAGDVGHPWFPAHSSISSFLPPSSWQVIRIDTDHIPGSSRVSYQHKCTYLDRAAVATHV